MEQQMKNIAIIEVKPDMDVAVIELHNKALELHAYAVARVVESDTDIKNAADDLNIIGGVKKAIEESRKAYTTPIRNHLDSINLAFKQFTEPLMEADRITRDKVTAYRAKEAAKAAEAKRINDLRMEAAQAEMKATGELTESVNLVEEPAAAPERLRAQSAVASFPVTWDYEVVDFAAVPDKYKVLDKVFVGKVVRAGERDIPGLRIFPKEGLSVRPNMVRASTPVRPLTPGEIENRRELE